MPVFFLSSIPLALSVSLFLPLFCLHTSLPPKHRFPFFFVLPPMNEPTHRPNQHKRSLHRILCFTNAFLILPPYSNMYTPKSPIVKTPFCPAPLYGPAFIFLVVFLYNVYRLVRFALKRRRRIYLYFPRPFFVPPPSSPHPSSALPVSCTFSAHFECTSAFSLSPPATHQRGVASARRECSRVHPQRVMSPPSPAPPPLPPPHQAAPPPRCTTR